MPAQTDARQGNLGSAREAARVVLAKHPCVTGGGASRTREGGGLLDLYLDCDRVLAVYQRKDVGRGEHAAGAGGSM